MVTASAAAGRPRREDEDASPPEGWRKRIFGICSDKRGATARQVQDVLDAEGFYIELKYVQVQLHNIAKYGWLRAEQGECEDCGHPHKVFFPTDEGRVYYGGGA